MKNLKTLRPLNTLKTALFGVAGLFGLGALALSSAEACTRAVYLGPDSMVVTGRTLDWIGPMPTNLWILPRGIQRVSFDKEPRLTWTSRYGSVAAVTYDIGTTEGMNEKGLLVQLLYLPGTRYDRPGPDDRPVMGMSIWCQYVLDNFATVSEAAAALRKDSFHINAPNLPGGAESTMHMAMSDPSGNSAIVEYVNGEITVYEGRQYQVLTNAPTFDKQLAIQQYWASVGGMNMLPGTGRPSDRFVRASFFINAVKQTSDPKEAVATVFSVMRAVSVPLGISTPEQPQNSSTQWRSVTNQKNRIYYFETTLATASLWVPFDEVDFSAGAPAKKLTLTGPQGDTYAGNAISHFVETKPFEFMFVIPDDFQM